MENMYQIKTKRLLLREIQEKDAEIIVKWRSAPQVYKYFREPHMLTIREHMEWFENVYMKQNNLVSWIGETCKIPVGVFGIKRTDNNEAEMSYIIAPEFQGNGYAEESMVGIINWICKNWDTKTIIAEIHKDNEASKKFINKMGFNKRSIHADFIVYEKVTESALYTGGVL